MKAATVHEIKKELDNADADRLRELCLRLAKYKVENKELLTYLLYDAEDENAYVENVKSEMGDLFRELPSENLYFAKKGLRKILRINNKRIRYSGVKQTELELRIHYCSLLKSSGIKFGTSQVLLNLYNQQLKKITATLTKLPEDLQYDYSQAIANLA